MLVTAIKNQKTGGGWPHSTPWEDCKIDIIPGVEIRLHLAHLPYF